MNKIKKYFLIGIIFLFISNNILQFASAEINDTSNNMIKPVKDCRQITFYRIDINGKIQPFVVEIDLENEDSEQLKIAEKCKELFNADNELQMSLNENKNEIKWIEVSSEGRGFHFSYRRIWITNRTVIWRTIIRYRFFFENDYTKIRSNESEQWKYLINGSQKVQLRGFTGYIHFKPKSLWGNTIIYGKTFSIDFATPRWPKN